MGNEKINKTQSGRGYLFRVWQVIYVIMIVNFVIQVQMKV